MYTQLTTIQYSHEDLIKAGTNKSRVPPAVYQTLKNLGISSVKPTKRGRRSFVKLQKPIPVIVSNKRRFIQHDQNCRISSARKIIPLDHNPSAKTTTPMKIGLWNAQSMMNKPTEVCDFVLTEKLDILAITEAWLRGDSRDGPALADIQSTLRDYHLLKMPRKGKKGGGVCVIVQNQHVTKTKPHSFETFECLEVLINTKYQGPISLIVIYRPPVRSHSIGHFFEEFSKLLESANLLSKHLLICGDFNIHVDNLHNADARTLYDLLESAGLQQVISEPTHTRGHTLDLLIVRESDDSIKDVAILPTMPSDHAAITFTVALPRPPVAKKQIRIRSLRDIDYEKFNDDIISSFERVTNIADLNLDGKVELYNATLLETLDWHSPTSLRCIQLRPYAPWYDESLKILKRNVRAKERKWRNSKSTINKELLKDASSEYQSALKGAKRAYHRDKISSCDQKELFRTIQRLTVENPAQIFPSHTSKKELSQRLSQYFENKIAKLRTRDDENAENGRSEPTEFF